MVQPCWWSLVCGGHCGDDGVLKTRSFRVPFLAADSKCWAAGGWWQLVKSCQPLVWWGRVTVRNGQFSETVGFRKAELKACGVAAVPVCQNEGGLASDTCCRVLAWLVPQRPALDLTLLPACLLLLGCLGSGLDLPEAS